MKPIKLLTLNTHSLIEQNYEQKLADFVAVVAAVQPDIIALQEVNQTMTASPVAHETLWGYTPCCDRGVIRADNHVYVAAKKLAEIEVAYHWTWLPVKNGYGHFEEGVALMSRSPISETKILDVSRQRSPEAADHWKTRKLLGLTTADHPDTWYFSVHLGWWQDKEEPFAEQWQRTKEQLPKGKSVWLMGDFNNPAEVRGEGYDLMVADGWYDTYVLASRKDDGLTVVSKGKAIDGWGAYSAPSGGMRIDQIWCNRAPCVTVSHVIFNGVHSPIISDHCGLMIEYERNHGA